MAICPKCTHEHVVKAGKVGDKQRWRCRAWGYQFTPITPCGRPLGPKSLAVFLYGHGVSMNALSKMFGVRASSVLKWIRRYATTHGGKPLSWSSMRCGTFSKKTPEALDLEGSCSCYRPALGLEVRA
jgi:transposase-like protein